MTTHYQTLKVPHVANEAEIQEAYLKARAAAIAAQPDLEPAQNANLNAVETAYTTLIDPNLRAAYDRTLGSLPGSSLMVAGQPDFVFRAPAPAAPVIEQACPHCGTPNPVQLTICQSCGQQVSRSCPSCGQQVLLTFTICPRCNTPLGEYDKFRYAKATSSAQRIDSERREIGKSVAAVEAVNRDWMFSGVAFWVLLIMVCIGLAVLAVVIFMVILNIAEREMIDQGSAWMRIILLS